MTENTFKEADVVRNLNGEFGEKHHSRPNTSLPTLEREVPLVFGDGSIWSNGGQQTGVDVIESPVSDRDRNYWLAFDKNGGHIQVDIADGGIDNPDRTYTPENAQIYIGTENSRHDSVQVQYSEQFEDAYFTNQIVADVDEATLEVIEKEILSELQKEFGEDVDVQFSSGGEPWDDVQVLFNHEYHGFDRDEKGRMTAYTSNVMFDLEENEQYKKLREQGIESIIYGALTRHGVEY